MNASVRLFQWTLTNKSNHKTVEGKRITHLNDVKAQTEGKQTNPSAVDVKYYLISLYFRKVILTSSALAEKT